MQNESSRALRRHHMLRLKAKWKSTHARYFENPKIPTTISHQKRAGMYLNTCTPCSCWMCGNPRKYSGDRTIQERRLMQQIEYADTDQLVEDLAENFNY